jgi:hypothetical protein
MNWEQRVSSVVSKQDLADFVSVLLEHLTAHREEWENTSLEDFLEAMAAWIRVMDQSNRNLGKEPVDSPSWAAMAQILLAASAYE